MCNPPKPPKKAPHCGFVQRSIPLYEEEEEEEEEGSAC